MKIRSLTLAAIAVASSAAFLAPAPASAWTCPEPYTQPYWVTDPTGREHRICTPYLSCETCFGIVR